MNSCTWLRCMKSLPRSGSEGAVARQRLYVPELV